MSSPREILIPTLSIPSATSQQESCERGSSPTTTRQNKVISDSLYIRFITPENALTQKLSGLPIFKSQIPPSTRVLALRDLVKRKVFQKHLNLPYVVDLHLPAHPILTDDVTLCDLGFVGTQKTLQNLFVVLQYNGTIGIPIKHFSDSRSTSNSNAWYLVEGVIRAGVSTFYTSLEILKRKVTDFPMQRRFLTVIWQTTHFLPAVYAMASLFDSRMLLPEEKAALAQTFQAFCINSVLKWAVGNKAENGFAKTLKDVIQVRKISGLWPLDGWDVGCLNASTVDTRRPREAVMICVDCSGSMSGPAFESEDQEIRALEKTTKLTVAKMLFKHYSNMVSNYKFSVHFGVMKFDSIVSIMQEFTPLLDDVEKGIEELSPNSSTAM
ncbi:hypothetical protein TWF970_008444 [Orbilia oligospora]|uniref:VWFA domain-containing protein n=1 Tax=Orbilia oligospora TaxID=2813651 RepID=A0A7C8RJ53_ORBOL|nr:hypothetical protein TWF970_008444 [Orbilia oligospora]